MSSDDPGRAGGPPPPPAGSSPYASPPPEAPAGYAGHAGSPGHAGHAGPPGYPGSSGVPSQRDPVVRPGFAATDAIGYGWRGFTRNVGTLLLLALVVLAVSSLLQWIGYRIEPGTFARWLWNVLSNIVGLVLAAGVVRAALAVVDGRKPQVGMLFSGPGTLTYIVAAVVTGILVTIGLILLIVPGLVLLFLLQFYGFAAIDEPGAGGLAAISRSIRLVSANVGQVLLFDLLAICVLVLGAIALGVGLLVAYPVVVIGAAYAFRRMEGGRVVEPA